MTGFNSQSEVARARATEAAPNGVSAPPQGVAGLPPVAAKHLHLREHHGRKFADHYEWLRDKDSPETLAYLEAENQYAQDQTAHLEGLTETIFGEIKSRIRETDLSLPSRHGQWWYYARTIEGKSYAVNCRVPATPGADVAAWEPPRWEGADIPEGEQILLDGNELAEGTEFFSLGAVALSRDGNLLAYSVDTVGDERYTLRIRDLTTGRDLPDEIPGIAAGATWSADAGYLFYQTVDEAWRPDTVMRHKLGTSLEEDVTVFKEPDERYWVGLGETQSERYLVIGVGSKVTSEMWILETDNPTGEFRCLRPRQEGVEYEVEHAITGGRDHLLVTHNAFGPNFSLSAGPVAPFAEFGELTEVIAHRENVRLEYVSPFAHHLVIGYRENALAQFGILPLTPDSDTLPGLSALVPVKIDEALYDSGLGANSEWDPPVLRFVYTSFITPTTIADYVLADGQVLVRKQQEVLGGYDPAEYRQERLWATAPDGARVPVSVVYKHGTTQAADQAAATRVPAPLLLYGYGSYEANMDPGFSVARLSLLDRGMIFAIAHVRGGGELGRNWYEDGKTLAKRNTFTDFIAVADHLIDQRYTTPAQQVALGGSAGGLLMGAVANLAPDRFAGIQAVVPFVDPLTSILMPELPLTVIEWDEWGDPLHNVEVYDYMAAYSPYENIEAKAYPAILAITSLNDTRVLYVEPAKWVAKLREISTGSAPILLKTEMQAGHGGVSGRYEKWRQTAFEYAWILVTSGAVAAGVAS